MEALQGALNNAYILFCFILGVYAATFAGRNVPISGDFWGAMWLNSGLAGAVLLVALVMTAQGLRPVGLAPDGSDRRIVRTVYYLYAVYFVISLPGVFAIRRGNDDRVTALFLSLVAFFNSAAAYRAGNILVSEWE